jgi:hypothetical protein
VLAGYGASGCTHRGTILTLVSAHVKTVEEQQGNLPFGNFAASCRRVGLRPSLGGTIFWGFQ